MSCKSVPIFLACLVFSQDASAFVVNNTPLTATQKHIETAGTAIAIALPVTAGLIAWSKNDKIGLAQLTAETLFTVGTAYALKNVVREERPNGQGRNSFPSSTTALSASGSSFLWGRYGWRYGLPAFVATQFVSYSRVQARDHRWYDTLASSAIAAGYGYILTTPFKKRYNIDTSLTATPDGAYVRVGYSW